MDLSRLGYVTCDLQAGCLIHPTCGSSATKHDSPQLSARLGMRNLVYNCSLGAGRSCWGGVCVELRPWKQETPALLPAEIPGRGPPVTTPSLVLCQWQEAGLDSGATWPAHSWRGRGTLCCKTSPVQQILIHAHFALHGRTCTLQHLPHEASHLWAYFPVVYNGTVPQGWDFMLLPSLFSTSPSLCTPLNQNAARNTYSQLATLNYSFWYFIFFACSFKLPSRCTVQLAKNISCFILIALNL